MTGRALGRLQSASTRQFDAPIADGSLTGGMIPKVASCVHAVRNGVGHAHILDGRMPHVLLLEVFTDAGDRHHGAPEAVPSTVAMNSPLMPTYPGDR